MFGFKKNSGRLADTRMGFTSYSTSRPQVRYLVKADLREVAGIEWSSYQIPLSAEGIAQVLSGPRHIGYVVELEQQVVAHAIVEYTPRAVVVQRLAVAPVERRRGLGRLLLEYLICLVERPKVKQYKLLVEVWERDLPVQQFLRACGLRCELVIEGGYVVGVPLGGRVVEDVYLFERRRRTKKNGN